MKFAQKTLKCMGCKTALPPGKATLCEHCADKEAEIYVKCLKQARLVLPLSLGCLILQKQFCGGCRGECQWP
jgi:hypothetical protein